MNWKTTVGAILLVAGLVILSIGCGFALLSIGTTSSVRVVDVETGQGISGADVWVGVNVGSFSEPEIYQVGAVTDSSGVAVLDFSDLPGPISGGAGFAVDAEGYTSDYSQCGLSFYGSPVSDPSGQADYLIELYSGEPTPPPVSSVDLTVEVADKSSGLAVAAAVHLFEGSVQVDVKSTDSDGVAVFEGLSGFYLVGVDAEGYTSEFAKDGYSYFGAAAVRRDITYPIALSPWSIIPDVEGEVSSMGAGLLMVVGVVVALAGGGFLAWDRQD